jgi:phenylacetate-CoA ligase
LLGRFLWYGLRGSGFGEASPDDLKRLQDRRLSYLAARAYNGTKFWHGWLDEAGVRPEEIRRVEDLRRLPLCNKGILMAQPYEDRRIGDLEHLVPAQTSGTTGPSMAACWSKSYNDFWASVVYFRMRALCGIGHHESMICLSYTAPRKPGQKRAPWSGLAVRRRKTALGFLEPIFSYAGKGIYDRLYFTYEIDEILPEIVRAKPAAVWGVSSLVRLLADAVAAGKAPGVHPRAIICGGDCLDDSSRAYFESVFDCPVLSMYAANEVGFIAMECRERGGMHVMADSMIVEVLRNGEAVAPGELGELVATPLLNGAMPMIRYNLGDAVRTTKEPCPCGRVTPMLKSVEGRTEDLLVVGGNRMISTREIGSILRVDGAPACQLTQEEPSHFKLKVYSEDNPPARQVAHDLLGKLGKILGDGISIDVSMDGPREDKRKLRASTSLIKPTLN